MTWEFNWSSLGIDEEEFDHYVTMDDNIDCYGDLTDDQIIQEVQGIPKADDNEEVEEEEVQIPIKGRHPSGFEYYTPLSHVHTGRFLSH